MIGLAARCLSPHSAPMDLTGKLLIAMPGMGDLRFEQTVILMCAHDAEGAMGLIINRPTPQLHFADLVKQIDLGKPLQAEDPAASLPVHAGGPVEQGRGFVLHSPDYRGNESTLAVSDDFGMTATRDVLEDIAAGRGPHKALLALGYAGWSPGQLEGEIGRNGWLTADASPQIVFDTKDDAKWEATLATLGVDPLMLSAEAGRA